MSLAKVNDEWVPLQIKVFTRWINSELKDLDIHIEDVTKDLSNGVALVELAKELTQKSLSREWCSNPKRNIEMVQNCDLAIEMFEKDGVRLVGISGKDINDNNTKLILGLIWSLILHYSIDRSIIESVNDNSNQTATSKSRKDALMSWAIERTANYPNIKNFKPYDLSVCALLDSYFPEKINYYSLNPNETEHNSKLATEVMNEIGIPVYVYPEDIQSQQNQIDDKTLLTQLSKAKVVLDKKSSTETLVQPVQEKSVTIDTSSQSEIERLRKELAEAKAQIQRERELREKAEKDLLEVSDRLKELEKDDSKSQINELILAKEEVENENFKLERKLAEVTSRLHQAEKQNKDDNSLLEKMSIELTEQEYEKMEECEENQENNEINGKNIIDAIVNLPKTIAKSVRDNIEKIGNIVDNTIYNETENSNNNNNGGNENGNINESSDTYTLTLMGYENLRYID